MLSFSGKNDAESFMNFVKGAGPSGMSGLPLHWVLYSTRVPTGLMYLDWALQVSLPGWAHSLEGGPNRYGVAWGALFREFDLCRA